MDWKIAEESDFMMKENEPARRELLINSINSLPTPEGKLVYIRSKQTHMLLALRCEQGILLFDRKARLQHLLTWEDMDYPQMK